MTAGFTITIAQAPLVVPGLREEMTNRQQRWFRIVGRLSDGTDPAHARAALEVIAARWRGTDAREYADVRIVVVRLHNRSAAIDVGWKNLRLCGRQSAEQKSGKSKRQA